MPASLQDWLAALVAAVALAWLVRRMWRARRRTNVCAGCEHCPMAAGAAAGPVAVAPPPGFVPLASLRRFDDEAVPSR